MIGLALVGLAHGQETVPAAPTDLQAVIFADMHFVGLTWHNNADNADGYQIERSTVSADGPWQTIATIPLVISKCDRPPCYFDTPSLNGDYWYRVAAVNAAGTSAYSNTVYAEIVAQPTPEPVILPSGGSGPGRDASLWPAIVVLLAAAVLMAGAGMLAARRR